MLFTISKDYKKMKLDVEKSSREFRSKRDNLHSVIEESRRHHELNRKKLDEKISRYSK